MRIGPENASGPHGDAPDMGLRLPNSAARAPTALRSSREFHSEIEITSPFRPRRDGPPFVSLGWFVLVRWVRAGRRAAASR